MKALRDEVVLEACRHVMGILSRVKAEPAIDRPLYLGLGIQHAKVVLAQRIDDKGVDPKQRGLWEDVYKQQFDLFCELKCKASRVRGGTQPVPFVLTAHSLTGSHTLELLWHADKPTTQAWEAGSFNRVEPLNGFVRAIYGHSAGPGQERP